MSKMKEYLLDQYEQEITPEIDDLIKMKEEEEGMSNCQECRIEIPTEHLSGLGTCPKCVRAWINDYKALHDRRYGKRRK